MHWNAHSLLRDYMNIPDISALHAILRLKAGLSPSQRLDELTVDLNRHNSFLRDFLDPSSKAITAVVGPYGAGKTHFLRLAKQEALKKGYAVASLTQETGPGSLSFPHRHMHLVLGSLVAPDPTGSAVEYAANLIEHEPRQFLWQTRDVIKDRPEFQSIENNLEWLMRGADHGRATRVLEYLSGTLLSGASSSANNRVRAYRLLEFWIEYLVFTVNCKGVVLLIDEMEGLFSGALYWSILSRRTAYRSLGYYASLGRRLRILTAFTPEGWHKLQEDVQTNAASLTAQSSTVFGEDVPSLLRNLRSIRPYELTELTTHQYDELYEKLKKLHAAARGYVPATNGHLRLPSRSGLTPRIFSRSVVSALEARWFAGS